MKKDYKLTKVLVVVTDGKAGEEVFTALTDACKSVGVSYDKGRTKMFIHEGRSVRISEAEIVRQKKGRKEDFRIKKNGNNNF